MPAGRPPLWTDPEALEQAVEEYFAKCESRILIKQVVSKGDIVRMEVPTPPTLCGLCLHLRISEDTLEEYGKRPEFCGIISRARARVKESTVSVAMIGALEPKIAGLVLSSDFGYTTRSEVGVTAETLEDILGKLGKGGTDG